MTNFANLSHDELRAEAVQLARQERQATAALIRCLMEVDARRLYLADGYSSLFTFCTQVLHLSEHAALGRIEVARAARRLPALLSYLEEGFITVTNARLLAPHLTESNCEELLLAARHQSKREVEEMVAKLRPQHDVRSAVRKLPSTPASANSPAPAPRAAVMEAPHVETLAARAPTPVRPVIAPLAPERYKIQFTASKELLDKLRYAQDLLRHVTPSGDVALVFDRALGALIEQLEKQKCGLTTRPRKPAACASDSRHIPAAVRREVWRRDGGRCAFVGAHGRCDARAFLEFHHVVPFAAGGRADSSNIQLRCRAHNRYEADLFFGEAVVRESPVRWEVASSGTGFREGMERSFDGCGHAGDEQGPWREDRLHNGRVLERESLSRAGIRDAASTSPGGFPTAPDAARVCGRRGAAPNFESPDTRLVPDRLVERGSRSGR